MPRDASVQRPQSARGVRQHHWAAADWRAYVPSDPRPNSAVSSRIRPQQRTPGVALLDQVLLSAADDLRPAKTSGSAPVPREMTAPLGPARKLVSDSLAWRQTFEDVREPILTRKAISGLQQVHDEWHKESEAQKALLRMHLEASVARLEVLEQAQRDSVKRMKQMEADHLSRIQQLERDHLRCIQDFGSRLQEKDEEIRDVRTQLDESERDRARLRMQLQELRKKQSTSRR